MSGTSGNTNILIIGAGTWGCSIALELARRGYQGIKVLDGSPFPSTISAGNDLNKIVEQGASPFAGAYSILSLPNIVGGSY